MILNDHSFPILHQRALEILEKNSEKVEEILHQAELDVGAGNEPQHDQADGLKFTPILDAKEATEDANETKASNDTADGKKDNDQEELVDGKSKERK